MWVSGLKSQRNPFEQYEMWKVDPYVTDIYKSTVPALLLIMGNFINSELFLSMEINLSLYFLAAGLSDQN